MPMTGPAALRVPHCVGDRGSNAVLNTPGFEDGTSMDYSMMFDSSPASRLPMKPSRGPAGQEAANGSFADVPRALLAAGIWVLMVALSGNAGYARDRLPGDVERLAMIGFTVANVDRETTFFTKVLSFEKVSDF